MFTKNLGFSLDPNFKGGLGFFFFFFNKGEITLTFKKKIWGIKIQYPQKGDFSNVLVP